MLSAASLRQQAIRQTCRGGTGRHALRLAAGHVLRSSRGFAPILQFCYFSTAPEEKRGLTLGIVRETYDKWERRTPLCPSHVDQLLTKFGKAGGGYGLLSDVLVQPASHRIFTDDEYRSAGAKITDDLSGADMILGVKQVEEDNLLPDKAYMFFSHVIKGQAENMPLMKTILDRNIQLFDYECINEEWVEQNEKKKRRLVAFGKYAGIAGMIDGLQALGRRLLAGGYSTPFLNCPPAYMYDNLEDAKRGIERIGELIERAGGLPGDLEPLVFAFTGKGNVSNGALEMFKLLPHKMITKDELPEIRKLEGPQKVVYGLVLDAEDLVRRKKYPAPETKFSFKHYVENPQCYESTFFEEVAPHVNMIVNGIYWDERFPRLLTKDQIKQLYEDGNRRLLAIADISCDIEGGIEFLEKSTTVEQPYFEYDPLTGEISDEISGDGVAMMGVDILPTELPRESSKHFGDALLPLMEQLIIAKGSSEAATLHALGDELPVELANACISAQGYLTPTFEYISEFLKKRDHAGHVNVHDPHILIALQGHLFDSGLINQVLDVMEHHDCHFEFQECNVKRKVEGKPEMSDVLLRVSAKDKDELDRVNDKVQSLVDLIVAAEASMQSFDVVMEKGKKKGKAVVKSEKEEKVLVLGAGRVAASLSEYLGRSKRRSIVVASQLEHEAQSVANEALRGTPVTLDVANDLPRLSKLVKDADVVVSLLPAPMHPIVANECITNKTDLVTASYVSPEISALQDRCEEAGVSILNEVGLDPGMDHMSAMRIIDGIKSRGGDVVGFSSVCGGLPAPEAANNPLMYKFSWSPMGVLRASQNDARYLMDGDVVNVAGNDLLASAQSFDAWPSLHLEVLPNRDSLVYAAKYGIQNAETIFRGTLRYHGFSSLLHVFKNMGLLDDTEAGGKSWGDVVKALQMKQGFSDLKTFLVACSGGDKATATKAATCLKFLDITAANNISKPESIAQSFCDALEAKLCFEDDERDMVLMHHNIQAAFEDGSRETHHSSLQLYGDEKMSAMCKTVGYTAAVGTDLMLSRTIGRKGILLPTSKDIYEPCLNALEKEGLKFEEEVLADVDTDEDVG